MPFDCIYTACHLTVLINYTACHLTVFNIAQNSFEKKKKVRSFMFHNMMF